MMEKLNFNTLAKPYRNIDPKYLYIDKYFNEEGTDYNHYMRIRFETINQNIIKDYYTIDGFYLMTHLISYAQNGQYIKTTINTLAEDTKLKAVRIKQLLIQLNKLQTVLISKIKGITYNTPIEIFITYNTTEYYRNPTNPDESKGGYRILPIDFIKVVLPTVTPEQWAIFCILVVRYSYYTLKKEYDKNSGRPYYLFKQNHYAFPTIEHISDILGIPDTTIWRYMNQLEKNSNKLIKIYSSKKVTFNGYRETGQAKWKMENRIYYIPLFERIEYVYNCIVKFKDNRPEDIKKLIKNKGFEQIRETDDYDILLDRDYLNTYFKMQIEEYEKAIKLCSTDEDNALDSYKHLREDLIKP